MQVKEKNPINTKKEHNTHAKVYDMKNIMYTVQTGASPLR